ncbi:hypothetical protein GIB67_007258 [Kingdonia uniflora]|uniref:Transketolase-like pyrimidine-binding domain-containing protein n=1 Tax=Kingdonia uniflora TaxID=39325 RepID=A0A7J7NX01_9MAGN|nr:hypothetical protein GIB67_007258 [Kingdonia uniflora]
MFDRSADLRVESIVIGISHRGKLNVLGNVVRKPFSQIFSEFTGGTKPVNDVGLYMGTVYETLHLSALPNYTTGGTIHIVVNNQVAFTTDPQAGRSSQYCTDVAKALNAPIFHQISRVRNTGVKPEILNTVGKAITTLPDTFKPHRAVKKIFELRRQMIETEEGIDWAIAEALAFATLPMEGNHVRLSGQDVERGTFSHRHFVLHNQETGEKYCPQDNILLNQNEEMFTVNNGSLSEFGVLGFELGYSMENPNSLVIWEAQFSDFANGAQVIFDQFLSSGESKWLRQTGLVVLLPHGYDGQGPEHSSAQMEYFLQISDDNPFVIPEMAPTLRKQIQECNWQVVNVTTPANYFHVLRCQIHRVKQLCPFPYDLIQRELKRYSNAEVTWCQEEPMNMGAYSYIAPRLGTVMKTLVRGTVEDVKYVGRAPSAATATSFYQVHVKGQTEPVEKALQLETINNPF